jgi:hypothetical protein
MARYSASVQDRLILPAQVSLTLGQEQVFRVLQRTRPAPVAVELLIDTGSARCTLVPSILARLNPDPLGAARLETGLAAVETSLFWIRLEFPRAGLAAVPEIAVARAPLPPSLSSFHGVIGRDLLRRWEAFVYQGRRGRLTIRDTPSWPFGWFPL